MQTRMLRFMRVDLLEQPVLAQTQQLLLLQLGIEELGSQVEQFCLLVVELLLFSYELVFQPF